MFPDLGRRLSLRAISDISMEIGSLTVIMEDLYIHAQLLSLLGDSQRPLFTRPHTVKRFVELISSTLCAAKMTNLARVPFESHYTSLAMQ
jgi:hypothetical protein